MAPKLYQTSYHSKHTTKQLFDVVSDIESYPEFLPWCTAARIIKKERDALTAELVIEFSPMHYTYVSEVNMDSPLGENSECVIDVKLIRGPFTALNNKWSFSPSGDGCQVDFSIEFEFSSPMLQKMIGLVFEKAVKKMTAAFQNRATHIYGTLY